MADQLIRRLAAAAVIIVAILGAVISWTHIYDLALSHGQSPLSARLVPFSVDGLLLAASMVMLDAARRQQSPPLLARSMLGLGVAATILANLAYGLPFGVLGAIVSGWPAVAFVGSAELIVNMVRTARRMADNQAQPSDGPLPAVHRIFSSEIAGKTAPSIREIRSALECGQSRAQQVQTYLKMLAES